jgi:GT2 family glycosyltransferase
MDEKRCEAIAAPGDVPELSIVVVNYNAGELLIDCISALLASMTDLEIVISDNGSTDDSLLQVQQRYGGDSRLRILANRANLGFAGGNNTALPMTAAPYILFLNPDCLVGPNTLPRMLDFMRRTPDAGMAGCIITNPDGTEQIASRRVIPNPWLGLLRILYLERWWPGLSSERRLDRTDEPRPEAPERVEAISGSLMLVRRHALEEVGPLDEGYFLHCEDLDWFVRFRRAGWFIYLVPDVEAVHHKGACSQGRPVAVLWHKHRGMSRFYRKFQFEEYPMPLSMLVLVGIWLHFVAVVSTALLRRQLNKVFRR